MAHHQQYTAHEHEQPDAWHRHDVAAEGAPQEEHGRTNPAVLVVAFLATFGFVAGTILASYLYFNLHMTKERREKIESNVLADSFFKVTQPAEMARLKDYGFSGEAAARAGAVSIPIDQAMQNVVNRYGKK